MTSNLKLKAVYIECDCQWGIDTKCAHPDTVYEWFDKESDAIAAFLRWGSNYICRADPLDYTNCCTYHSGKSRYRSIHGPGGHVHGVRRV